MPRDPTSKPSTGHGIAIRAGGWILTLAIVGLWIGVRQLWWGSEPTRPIAEAEYKVDVNHASERDLLNLPEVGPSLARKILSYREQHGEFYSLSDFGEVPGVGPQTLKLLAPFLSFENRPDATTEYKPEEDTPEDTILTAQSRERISP